MRPLALVLAVSALCPAAFAQSDPLPELVEGHPVVYKAVTEIDYEGLGVHAALVGPSGAIVAGDAARSHVSLIQVRASFSPELDQSAREVK